MGFGHWIALYQLHLYYQLYTNHAKNVSNCGYRLDVKANVIFKMLLLNLFHFKSIFVCFVLPMRDNI